MQVRTYMLKNIFIIFLMMAALGCKKQNNLPQSLTQAGSASQDNKGAENEATSNFNLEVVLNGEGNTNGHIHFRQDPDPAKIITLDTKIHHLLPNHEYLLQRAVDPINVVDGNCTSTSWLTLGHGLTPQSILTDDKGNGEEELWRDVTAVPSGSMFDIHFRVIDAISHEVVLTSDCYQYTVR
jgi:hypothetical protein